MKRLCWLLLAALWMAPQVYANDMRIVFVDTARIYRDSAPAKKAMAKLEKEFAAREVQLQKLVKQAQELSAALEKNTVSDNERRTKERDLGLVNRDLQRLEREFREDLNIRRNEEMGVIQDRAMKVIQQLADAEKYDIVLQEAVYRNPRIDITDKVLRLLTERDK